MSIPQHEDHNHAELKSMHDEEANQRDESFHAEPVTAAPWRMRGAVASQIGLSEGDMYLQTPKGDQTNLPARGPVQGLPLEGDRTSQAMSHSVVDSPLWRSLQGLPCTAGPGDPPLIDAIRDRSAWIHGHHPPVESVQSSCHLLDAKLESSDLPPSAGFTAARHVSIPLLELG